MLTLTQTKRSDSNAGNDSEFESAFSSLAHAYIQDRAPGLQMYEVGFQLVDRDDDSFNPKALGILGYKVGKQWLYATVFFINGALKGHELLYIKNQDAFVPLKENWINYLLAKTPASLGEGVDRNTRQLGVHYPDLFRALQSPHKYAAAGPVPGDPNFESALAASMHAHGAKFTGGPATTHAHGAKFTGGPAPTQKKPHLTGPIDRHGKPLPGHPGFNDDLRSAMDAQGAKYASRITQEDRAAIATEAAPLRTKLASAGFDRPLKDWATVGTAAILRHFGVDDAYPMRLLDVVEAGGVKAAEALFSTLQAYPALQPAFQRFYPADRLKQAMEAIKARPEGTVKRRIIKRASTFTGSVLDLRDRQVRNKVEVHRFQGFGKQASVLLDQADKETLVRQGYLIKDAREDEEVSKAYAVPTEIETTERLTTANEPGIYDVLARSGNFEKCLIVLGPMAGGARKSFATVVRLNEGSKKRDWLNIHPSYVFVAKQYRGWSAWWEALPDAKELSKDGGPYMILGPDGQGTVPFTVRKDLGTDAGGGELYSVRFDDYCRRPRAGAATGVHLSGIYPEADGMDNYEPWTDGERIHLGHKTGTKFRVDRGDVYVPVGYKLLKLKDDEATEDSKDNTPGECCSPSDQSSDPPFVPGSATDIRMHIFGKHATLRIIPRTSGFVIDDQVNDNLVKNAVDSLVHLVTKHGFREDTAQELLKQAGDAYRKGHTEFKCLVKYADAYTGGQYGGQGDPYLTSGGPYAPDMIDPMQGYDDVMGSAVPAQHPLEESIRVNDMRADPRNRDAYDPANPDPMSTQIAQDAADKGQKEVFDTAQISNLLKMTRDEDLFEDGVEDAMKTLDWLGRRIFLIYYHADKFAERYGDSDMKELEDGLKNSFQDLGDLILFFKQKNVDANPQESAQDIDLGHVADH